MSVNEFTTGELVEFKGSKKGIIVNIKRKATFDEIKNSIIDKLESSIGFFNGAKICSINCEYLSDIQIMMLKDGVNVKLEDTDKVNASYLRKAIKELNPKITDEKIDSYKESYKSFAWAVAVAPADDPEIAVVAMIPQGESSSNAMLLIREVLGSYFDLDNNKGEKNNKNDENTGTIEKENINFVSQMKK